MKPLTLNLDKLLVNLIFLIPLVHILIILINFIPIFSEISIVQYFFLLLILTYVILFKRKIIFKSLLPIFFVLYVRNIFQASDMWFSLRELVPINLVINVVILMLSDNFKLSLVNEKMRHLVFLAILVSFYVFILGIDFMGESRIGHYHSGIFYLPHTASYYLLVIFVYYFIIKNTFNPYLFLSLSGIFLSGVRSVTLVLLFLIFIKFIKGLDIFRKPNYKQIIIVVSLIMSIAIMICFFKTDYIENVIDRLTGLTDFSDPNTYGSGRLAITAVLMKDIVNRDLFGLLFGKPVQQVFELNYQFLGGYIWAHNDFIMVLFTLGLVGFFIYFFYLVISPVLHANRNKNLNKNSRYNVYYLIFTIVLLALSNGFYTYYSSPIFVYFMALALHEVKQIK